MGLKVDRGKGQKGSRVVKGQTGGIPKYNFSAH